MYADSQIDKAVGDNLYLADSNSGYMCCMHETPRTLEWCEENCNRYYRCDTAATAIDEDRNAEDLLCAS